jgi:hypothetical protein
LVCFTGLSVNVSGRQKGDMWKGDNSVWSILGQAGSRR